MYALKFDGELQEAIAFNLALYLDSPSGDRYMDLSKVCPILQWTRARSMGSLHCTVNLAKQLLIHKPGI